MNVKADVFDVWNDKLFISPLLPIDPGFSYRVGE